MAIGVYFAPKAVNGQKYNDVMKQLEAAGAASPRGRSHHSAFGDPNELHVFEIWDSQADFDAFGAILMPILAKAGIDPGQPNVVPVHNVVQG